MRVLLVLVGLAALVFVALLSLGMVTLDTKPGSLPSIAVQGGTAPEFKANVGSVALTTTNKSVEVPTVTTTTKTIAVPSLQVERAANSQAPAN